MKDHCGLRWIIKNQNLKYSYNYQNWYPAVEFETKNARKNVGLFDLTAFSKYDLKGQKNP